ncbi:hypothetical protein [uncultured Paraglaciecola sp.]|uniref:hypothetical protein n=1 Tax=uncultured Paraglaciecola sp. TaxID=1765024 RepID=UPI00262582F4|nr:hypothetical protein [uncultured Paraglaciecola sp.]
MILRSVTKHVKDQNWFAVFLDFFIVVVGVFIGLQVANWNEARQNLDKEQFYIERLKEELTVTIERLEGASQLYLKSINAIQLLLDARNAYQLNPDTYQADEDDLIIAFVDITRGRVPASSPAVFEEMVANGELVLIRNSKLRQALYEFDEFSKVSIYGWKTLRDQLLNAMQPTTGILIYKAKTTAASYSQARYVEPDTFDLTRLLTQPNLSGALSTAMAAQENQLTFARRQLKLAKAIQAQIESQNDY